MRKLKGLFLILVLAIITVSGAFAQTWYDSYASGIENNKLFINVGIGFGPTSGYTMGIPPISASLDYKLPIDLPITIGAMAAYTTWKYSVGIPSIYKIDVTYTNIGFGVRGMYHFNFMENLDTYAGLTIGYVIQSAKAETSGSYGSYDTGYDGVSFFLWGGNIGARYFFTDLVGVYFELGYSGLQFAGVGV